MRFNKHFWGGITLSGFGFTLFNIRGDILTNEWAYVIRVGAGFFFIALGAREMSKY